jgi:hypothetical protein
MKTDRELKQKEKEKTKQLKVGRENSIKMKQEHYKKIYF